MIEISKIELDATTQCRASIRAETVKEYAEAIQAGAKFPPIKLFFDGQKFWVGDGWTRIYAHKEAGKTTILEDVTPGTRQDAIKYALSANATHGQRRTNDDKRRAVEIALREWPGLSSRAIAEMCAVSDKTVEAARSTAEIPQLKEARTGKDGKKRKQRPKPEPVEPPKVEAPEPPPEDFDERDNELAILAEVNEALTADNKRLAAATAEAAGDEAKRIVAELQQANDLLQEENGRLHNELKQALARERAVIATRDRLMNENAAMKRQIAQLQRKLEREAA